MYIYGYVYMYVCMCAYVCIHSMPTVVYLFILLFLNECILHICFSFVYLCVRNDNVVI